MLYPDRELFAPCAPEQPFGLLEKASLPPCVLYVLEKLLLLLADQLLPWQPSLAVQHQL